MTEPDDRAHGALPEGTPDDEAPDAAQPDDENGVDPALDDETGGEDAGFAEPEQVAGAALSAPKAARAGRASASSREPGRGPRRREPAAPARAQTASDIAVHVDDRISAIFVAGVIAVFVLIFLNALVLGKGGILTPIPTPRPVASASPAASVAPIASASPAASAQASAAPSASASASAAASATPKTTPKPSATPRPSASPAPSPSK